jgi:hypothetical protein
MALGSPPGSPDASTPAREGEACGRWWEEVSAPGEVGKVWRMGVSQSQSRVTQKWAPLSISTLIV